MYPLEPKGLREDILERSGFVGAVETAGSGRRDQLVHCERNSDSDIVRFRCISVLVLFVVV